MRMTVRRWLIVGWATVAAGCLLMVILAFAQTPNQDPRYCGPPARTGTGHIKRSSAARAMFAAWHPCPAASAPTGPCPGWAVDHVIPLACGGCDAPTNMQWLPLSIKSCAGDQCKDRWERRVYRADLAC